MKRVHIAIGVADFDASVTDYNSRLEAVPVVVVPGEYALWRTDVLQNSVESGRAIRLKAATPIRTKAAT
jgi:hypothetical protein